MTTASALDSPSTLVPERRRMWADFYKRTTRKIVQEYLRIRNTGSPEELSFARLVLETRGSAIRSQAVHSSDDPITVMLSGLDREITALLEAGSPIRVARVTSALASHRRARVSQQDTARRVRGSVKPKHDNLMPASYYN